MQQRSASVVPASLLEGVIEQFRPVRVILFGSRARGDAGPDSDIDLLVVVEDDLPPERRGWEAVNAARAGHRGDVDIIPWPRADYEAVRGVVGSLPWTADREGIVVYGTQEPPVSGDPAGMRREEARRWLSYAEEDLATVDACLGRSPPLLRNAAYHCQQCAEKLIKGCLILAEVPFPKTHNLQDLLGFLPATVPGELVVAMRQVAGLTPWAVSGRYPSAGEQGDRRSTLPAVQAALRDLEALRTLVVGEVDGA